MKAPDLVALRRQLGMTQVQLAAALEVTPNTVARWEQGVHAISPLAARALTHLVQTHGGRPKRRRASA